MGIVESFCWVVDFLIPQISLFHLPFQVIFAHLHFYHSSHSRSSEMDLSLHKSHPVFSSLRLSSYSTYFLFTLDFYSKWTFVCGKITYGRNGSERIFCIKQWDQMGGTLSKTLLALNRLQRCWLHWRYLALFLRFYLLLL